MPAVVATVGCLVAMSGCYVETAAPTDVDPTGATLNAVGRSDDVAASFYFEYGTRADFYGASETPPQGPFPPHQQTISLSQRVGLNPGSTYYVRACGYESPASRACSSDVRTIVTSPCASVGGSGASEQSLTIDPGCGGVTESDFDLLSPAPPSGPIVAVVASLPASRLVDQVTVGDVGLGPSCEQGRSSVRLAIGRIPAFRLDGEAPLTTSALVDLPATPGPVAFSVPPTLLKRGAGYVFRLVLDSGCRLARRTTWSHTGSTVGVGNHRCGPAPDGYLSLRFWHTKNVADWATCPGIDSAPAISVPENADATMPSGWLQGFYIENATVVQITRRRGLNGEPGDIVSGGCDVENRASLVYWRNDPQQTGESDWVCVYPQYQAPDTTSANDWHWTTRWRSTSNAFPPGQVRDAYLKLHTNSDAVKAYRFEPVLRFDGSERWRPLTIESFFAERSGAQSSHRVCNAGGSCAPLRSVEDLWFATDAQAYIDVGGSIGLVGNEDDAASSYGSPNPDCHVSDLVDCNAGPASAMYYIVSGPFVDTVYRFWDYWMFYRVNYVAPTADFHEGDWEGVSVVPSVEEPDTFDFAGFSQHGTYFAYLRDVLRCGDSAPAGLPVAGSCGVENGGHYGRRIHTMVANGSHANYTTPCSETIVLVSCQGSGSFLSRERGYDGSGSWGNAFAADAGAVVLPMPPPGTLRDPAHWNGSWSDWPGAWGFEAKFGGTRPLSPLRQGVGFACAEIDNPSCPAIPARGAARRSRTAGYRSPLARAATGCGAWVGAGVAALECDGRRLAAALRSGSLGKQYTGGLRVAFRRRSIEAGKAVSQLVGGPLRPGARVLPSLAAVGRNRLVVVRVYDRKRRRLYLASFRGRNLLRANPALRGLRRRGRRSSLRGLVVSVRPTKTRGTALVRLGNARPSRQVSARVRPPRHAQPTPR